MFRDSVLQQTDVELLIAGQDDDAGHRLWRLCRPQLAVGRSRLWLRSELPLFRRLSTSTASNASRSSIRPVRSTLRRHHHVWRDADRPRRGAAQGRDHVPGACGLGHRHFLPYVFGGLAVGHMDVSRSVTSSVTGATTSPHRHLRRYDHDERNFVSRSLAVPDLDRAKTNAFVLGWTGGLGLEYMVWSNFFLRGEWEYVKFLSVKNTIVHDSTPARRHRLQVLNVTIA